MTRAAEAERYPIGRLDLRASSPAAGRPVWIDQIAALPGELDAAIAELDDARLDTPYREGGWTVRQLVHHIADSHINAYCRFRLALTETAPLIRVYDEKAWAELADARTAEPRVSQMLLHALHERWTRLLRAMREEDFERALEHPELGTLRLHDMLRLYAWHGRHHVAHITRLRARRGW
jgi:uncharacterized damage-inducible protein DinB